MCGITIFLSVTKAQTALWRPGGNTRFGMGKCEDNNGRLRANRYSTRDSTVYSTEGVVELSAIASAVFKLGGYIGGELLDGSVGLDQLLDFMDRVKNGGVVLASECAAYAGE